MKNSLWSTVFAVSLCVPALAQDATREVTGSVTYLPKIALPAGAEIEVNVEGDFGTTLGAATSKTAGEQVPVPFAVSITPDLKGRLNALVRLEGRPLWVARDLSIPTGSKSFDIGMVRLDPVTPLTNATSYDCGGLTVAFGILDDKAALRVGEREFEMVQAIAASGARFIAVGDESTEFWSKGDHAMLTVEGQEMEDCVAVSSDITPYLAGGNEPGWNVTLGQETVDLTADYGAITRSTARPDVQAQPGAYVFDMPDIGARLTLEDRLCADDATGMPHPHHATLALDGRTLTGCGGDPRSLLTGPEWRIEDVDGKAIIDASEITLHFGSGGRVSGSSGCNRFMGGYDLTGEGLDFDRMASTMMACPEALMTQERAVLNALSAVRRFGFDDTGALLLIGGPDDAPLLTARRG